MSRSFRVSLVFGIAVSCLTSLGSASVVAPTLNWDAAEDSSSQYWDSKFNGAGLNQHNNRRWNFGSNVTADDASGSNFGAITKSYDEKAEMNSFQKLNFTGTNPTNQDATFELIVRPDEFSGDQTIFETGGNSDGTSLWLDGSSLKLHVKNYSGNPNRQAMIKTVLPTTGIFYDILSTIGVSTDEIRLYVNGSLMASGGFSGDGNLTDWAGGDGSGLSTIGGYAAGNSGGNLKGDVAIMRYYRNDILDQSEIDGNFAAMQAIPEPSSIAMWSALGIIGLAVARRKRKLTRAA